jgi:hypothetical protein
VIDSVRVFWVDDLKVRREMIKVPVKRPESREYFVDLLADRRII